MVFSLGWKVFGFCLGFGVESFRIGLKVLGFAGGFFFPGLCDLAKGLGFRVLGFCLGFGV